MQVVRSALSAPCRWIAENAGAEGGVVVASVAELQPGHGFNAATGEYGDLMAQGVIDPVKVTRSAVLNAASIAAMLLTTEVLVAEKPEQEQPRGAARPRPRPLTAPPAARPAAPVRHRPRRPGVHACPGARRRGARALPAHARRATRVSASGSTAGSAAVGTVLGIGIARLPYFA